LQRRAHDPVVHHRGAHRPVPAGRGEYRIGQRGRRQQRCEYGEQAARVVERHADQGTRHRHRAEPDAQAAAGQFRRAERTQPGRPVDQAGLGAELGDRAGDGEHGRGGEERTRAGGAQAMGDQPRRTEPGDAGEHRPRQVGQAAPGHAAHAARDRRGRAGGRGRDG
jgi:hypothetical protein